MRKSQGVTAFLLLTGSVIAQTPSASPGTDRPPKFDVATIKPAAPGADDGVSLTPGGRFSATNTTLKDLIGDAYLMPFFRILGGPPRLDSIGYDIEAKPDTPVKESAWRVMLQGLLAERFQLKFHREARELLVYALVLARRNGKLGHGITESKQGGCSPLPWGTVLTAPGEFKAVAASVNSLTVLSHVFGRLIVDKTGLTGKYDIVFQWSPENPATASQQDASRTAPSPDPARPSSFAAFQEQLGLKLVSTKGPVEVIVIDHAEKPGEN